MAVGKAVAVAVGEAVEMAVGETVAVAVGSILVTVVGEILAVAVGAIVAVAPSEVGIAEGASALQAARKARTIRPRTQRRRGFSCLVALDNLVTPNFA